MAETTAGAKADKKPRDSKQVNESSFDMDELRELMELVTEQGFTEFEFENENIRVRLSKAAPFVSTAHAMPPSISEHAVSGLPQTGSRVQTDSSAQLAESEDTLHKITSPIVGTFYRASGPDKEPYVKEGSTVTPDTVVCIVEAMKLMNEIQAEVAGEVVKVYVENGQPVEFGQPLFGIKK